MPRSSAFVTRSRRTVGGNKHCCNQLLNKHCLHAKVRDDSFLNAGAYSWASKELLTRGWTVTWDKKIQCSQALWGQWLNLSATHLPVSLWIWSASQRLRWESPAAHLLQLGGGTCAVWGSSLGHWELALQAHGEACLFWALVSHEHTLLDTGLNIKIIGHSSGPLSLSLYYPLPRWRCLRCYAVEDLTPSTSLNTSLWFKINRPEPKFSMLKMEKSS